MNEIRQTIAGKKLAKFLKIPEEIKDKDVEIIIRPIIKRKKRFIKIYSSPIKVKSVTIPSRIERNER